MYLGLGSLIKKRKNAFHTDKTRHERQSRRETVQKTIHLDTILIQFQPGHPPISLVDVLRCARLHSRTFRPQCPSGCNYQSLFVHRFEFRVIEYKKRGCVPYRKSSVLITTISFTVTNFIFYLSQITYTEYKLMKLFDSK